LCHSNLVAATDGSIKNYVLFSVQKKRNGLFFVGAPASGSGGVFVLPNAMTAGWPNLQLFKPVCDHFVHTRNFSSDPLEQNRTNEPASWVKKLKTAMG
jgi:hypothetical protein